VEKPALQELPPERFELFHEGNRRVSRDGHIAVNHTYYSVPPEYLGCDVFIRYDSRILRVFNANMKCIATHVIGDPGTFRTNSGHISGRKIAAIEKGIEHFLRKTRRIGPEACRWAEAVVESRGVEACRVLQGLLSLSRKFSTDEINRACDIAWRSRSFNYRTLRKLLEAKRAASQTVMDFMDSHPIIRELDEYGDFIRESIQGGLK
jgi:hypothetical protein